MHLSGVEHAPTHTGHRGEYPKLDYAEGSRYVGGGSGAGSPGHRRPPFALLWRRHMVARLSRSSVPPSALGTMWSTLRSSVVPHTTHAGCSRLTLAASRCQLAV